MCKEDVRIGRAKETVAAETLGISSGDSARVLTANPNRAGVVASLLVTPAADPQAVASLRAASETGPVIGVVSVARPFWRGSVEEYGDGITQSIWVVCHGGGDAVIAVSEMRWNESLGAL